MIDRRKNPQSGDRAPQQSRDLHLAHPDDLADLGLREVLLEAQPDHVTLALRERPHEVFEHRALLGPIVALLDPADSVTQRGAGLLLAALERRVERRRTIGAR